MAHQNYFNSLTDEESADEQSDGKSGNETMYKSLDGSTYSSSSLISPGYHSSASRGNFSLLSDEDLDDHTDSRQTSGKDGGGKRRPYLGYTDEESDEQSDLNIPGNKRHKSSDWDADDYVPQRTLSGRSDSTGSSNFDDASPGVSASMNIMPMGGSMPDIHYSHSKAQEASNSVAFNIMKKMGFKEGSGLGKFEQGRKTIVEASNQVGRRGLGLSVAGLDPEDLEWDFSQELVEVEEEVSWIPSGEHLQVPDLDLLHSWTSVGPKKKNIDDETQYCDPEILSQISSCKSIFDNLELPVMRKAVVRSNPFESIKGGIFQNRAAMKMANLDYQFDYMFTNPVDEHGSSMVDPMGLLYFADVCAGPGGFSEYVLWKKRWEAKGFGFTLRSSNDFKLDEFFAGSPETFEPHYGQDGTGDIFKPENLTCFSEYVHSRTDNLGVHFMMADGGFSVEGQENLQEVLSKQLYLCQCLCALLILRDGGHFVCKLFDVFTPFSVGLVYLMYLCFKHVSLHKPNTSRPANSERYIICKWKRDDIKPIVDYLFDINIQLNETYLTSDSTQDILHLVDPDIIQGDEAFFNYILDSNNRIGTRQIIYLNKVRFFAKDSKLHEARQPEMKRKCLATWKVPDRVRSAPPKPEPEMRFNELVKNSTSIPFSSEPVILNCQALETIMGLYDYHCVVLSDSSSQSAASSSNFFFLFGLGRTHVFTRASKQARWIKSMDRFKLELPSGTLLYAEYVRELTGEGRAQKNIPTVHIIDALFLGEKDVRHLPYYERMAQANRLVKAVSKPSNPELCPVRVKEVFPLIDLERILERLVMKQTKNANSIPYRLCYAIDNSRYFFPAGVLMFKAVKDPWMIGLSKRENKYYFFNTRSKKSTFEPSSSTVASFSESFPNRFLWRWEAGVLSEDGAESCMKEDRVHRSRLLGKVAALRRNLR